MINKNVIKGNFRIILKAKYNHLLLEFKTEDLHQEDLHLLKYHHSNQEKYIGEINKTFKKLNKNVDWLDKEQKIF